MKPQLVDEIEQCFKQREERLEAASEAVRTLRSRGASEDVVRTLLEEELSLKGGEIAQVLEAAR